MRSGAGAELGGRALVGARSRYDRSVVIALQASQAQTIRASRGIPRRRAPSGYPPPSQRSWHERTIPPTSPSSPPIWLEHLLADDRVRLHQRPLVLVERARLVDDLGGIFTLPTSCRSAANSAWRARAVEPEAVGDAEHEVDDVATVAARVLVVGLDDVAEQHRGAAVRARELERVVDAALALARERREQQEHRQNEQERPRVTV